MLKKTLIASTVVALSCPSPAEAMGACYSACSWVTWGEREQVCANPSEGLWDDLLACMRRPDGDPAGGCATTCAGYLAGYDACAASADPACVPFGPLVCGAPPTACDECIAGSCSAYSVPCSEDNTECVTCNAWRLGGFDGNLLCSSAPNSIDAAVDLSTCACAGNCANKCGSACSHPCGWVYDGASATNACEMCLADAAPKGCSVALGVCLAN